jgi:hypothetical protein
MALVRHCPFLGLLHAQPNELSVPQPKVANPRGILVPHNPQSVEQTQQFVRVEHNFAADRRRLRRVAMEPLHHDEPVWPQRLVTVLQRSALLNLAWDDNELATGVLKTLGLDMPMLDLNGVRQMFLTPRRPVSIPLQRNASASS